MLIIAELVPSASYKPKAWLKYCTLLKLSGKQKFHASKMEYRNTIVSKKKKHTHKMIDILYINVLRWVFLSMLKHIL